VRNDEAHCAPPLTSGIKKGREFRNRLPAPNGECVADLADFPAAAMNRPHENTADPPEVTPSPSAPSQPLPERPREIGGRDGPEPTRYGDWEKAGRCIDF
jgi:hypothetical protein